MKNQKSNWWLDATLFTGFMVTFLMDLTGVVLHQWIGILLGGFILVHLAFHWKWVITVVGNFFGRTSMRARINLMINSGLVFGFLSITFTGLVISTWLDLSLSNFAVWKNIHVLSSLATLFLLLVKIVLHRKWIINVAEKHVFTINEKVINPLPVEFQPGRTQISRREFLKIGGVVGAASLVGVSQMAKLVQATTILSDSQIGSQSLTSQQVASINPVSIAGNSPTIQASQLSVKPTVLPVQNETSASCTVRCPKGCSFPGRCKRYTDQNGNKKCDLGECI